MWCFIYWLELAMEDVLQVFTKPIIEPLMNLNCLYNELLQKLRDLRSLFKDIKEDFGMFRDGVQPVSTGTRCIDLCIHAID